MSHIRKMVVRYLSCITLIIVFVILAITIMTHIFSEQRQAKYNSRDVFSQIESILSENQAELEDVKAEYNDTCLSNAEGIAYIIQNNPEIMDDVAELKMIAEFMEVDEIHIFDQTGRIFAGTHPEYYNYTVDSGEQMAFFKPMLSDKTLKLCQNIEANTAEGKLMQYSAVWSENGAFIVQVGMSPDAVMKVTKKNELSYIFSLLKANAGVDLYAINAETGEVMGSTVPEVVGKHMTEIGFNKERINKRGDGFHATVIGTDSYCVFTQMGDNLIGRVVSNEVLYQNIPGNLVELGMCLLIIAIILVVCVSGYINKYVINGIEEVNGKLRAIADGKLDETVDVKSSYEFYELSGHINEMVKSLLANTKKISYIINRTNLHIGVYEYSISKKYVRFTEQVAKILWLDKEMEKELTSDSDLFKKYMEDLRENKITGAGEIFCLDADGEKYVRLEEVTKDNDVLGIVMDATEEMMRRRQIEAERDNDTLTGLYNRRGLENRLSELFAEPEKLGYGALIMIDADGLKGINDKYGHEMGDAYLKKVSEAISSFNQYNGIFARQGGDEFVVFLYNYPSEEKLMESIATLEYIQNNSTAYLDSELCVPLRFSFGYSLTRGESDYQTLLKKADEKMYKNKSERKKDNV